MTGRSFLEGTYDEIMVDITVDNSSIVTKNDKAEVQYQYEKVSAILVTFDVVIKIPKNKDKKDEVKIGK